MDIIGRNTGNLDGVAEDFGDVKESAVAGGAEGVLGVGHQLRGSRTSEQGEGRQEEAEEPVHRSAGRKGNDDRSEADGNFQRQRRRTTVGLERGSSTRKATEGEPTWRQAATRQADGRGRRAGPQVSCPALLLHFDLIRCSADCSNRPEATIAGADGIACNCGLSHLHEQTQKPSIPGCGGSQLIGNLTYRFASVGVVALTRRPVAGSELAIAWQLGAFRAGQSAAATNQLTRN